MSSLDELFGKQTKVKNGLVALIDFSGLLHSSYHAQVRFDRSLSSDFERYAMWRYLLINMILKQKNKHQPDEVVLCIDRKSWRRDYFKYYKAGRVLARRKQDDFNYEEFKKTSNEFIEEMRENFPFKIIESDRAEGDDCIAVLAHELSKEKRPVVVISRDKDFKQLLKLDGVTMYDPMANKFVEESDPNMYLLEHILRGDSSDSIPNMFSDDDVFVNEGKRQKPITKKLIAELFELGMDKFVVKNGLVDKYDRNRKLVELSDETIPTDVWNDIVYKYRNISPPQNYMKILQFLRKHNMRTLIDKADSFL